MSSNIPRLVVLGFGLFLGLCAPSRAQAPLASASTPEERPDIDLYALMSGSCGAVKVDGREFPCKTVAFFHSEKGRAHFTVALDDPNDESHIIAFSGINGRRSVQNVYVLPVDRMLLNSKHRPKVDGIPVPAAQSSSGVCRQVGNFAMLKVTSVTCTAKDDAGRLYELKFVSDGSPITLRRVRQTMTNAEHDPYQ
ncbi:conserved hypothetical protein [Bradyrhizobium sp. ORS 375]|uniref:hypothetical protein n=1 Tax=Bradyrhizobium sp. (strain ORS 375) TaxID=566679 RepID=UPI0002407B74|nr:hypothetical protein [Bradyrhizobium sp. ORS 375]CCD97262.1 conserved hypothetical protein [Bradyrhizobium sp. ORS 375]